MAAISVRDLDDLVREGLRVRAAQRGSFQGGRDPRNPD